MTVIISMTDMIWYIWYDFLLQEICQSRFSDNFMGILINPYCDWSFLIIVGAVFSEDIVDEHIRSMKRAVMSARDLFVSPKMRYWTLHGLVEIAVMHK